jgi:hypothetical protein
MCSKHVLISIYFNVILEFPVQLYITFSNVVQKCVKESDVECTI